MNQASLFSLKVGAMKGLFFTILFFSSSFAFSQSAINILDLYHDSFRDSKAYLVTANANIGDYNFHANIGGVSFQAVASPSRQLENRIISLDFEDNQMIIKAGNVVLYSNLPVWQLVPIVKYVNSPYNVAVSQLGDTTRNLGAQIRFHPAFLDNLLGLRLFQADLLNLTDVLWDIPIDSQRRYILAQSEQGFKPFKDKALQRNFYERLKSGDFTTFVLTDMDVNIVFDIDEYGLRFSGKPYYYFLKSAMDSEKVRQIKLKMENCYSEIETNARIILRDKYNSALNPRSNLKGLLEALNKQKKESNVNSTATRNLEKALNDLNALNKTTNAELGVTYQYLREYSESFKSYWESLKKINPLVFAAVENTSKWSAFFRYIKSSNPESWSRFVQKVENNARWDAPSIKTPTYSEINYFRYIEEKEKTNR